MPSSSLILTQRGDEGIAGECIPRSLSIHGDQEKEMAVALDPIHFTATVGPASSIWPADWPSFVPRNISGGASLGGGISALQTLSVHYSIVVQYIENYSAVGNNPGSLRLGAFADQHGTTGSKNGFAVFPTFANGMMATADCSMAIRTIR